MSTTPRTDAAIVEVDVAFVGLEGLSSSPEKYIEADFARQLERELAEAKKDSARLDWLDKHPVNPQRVYDLYNGGPYRAAIDGAMGGYK